MPKEKWPVDVLEELMHEDSSLAEGGPRAPVEVRGSPSVKEGARKSF